MKQGNYLYGLLNVCTSKKSGFYVNIMTDTLGINELESAVMNIYNEAQACYLYSVGILTPEEVDWSMYSDRTETGLYIRDGKSHYSSVDISDFTPPIGTVISAHSTNYDIDITKSFTTNFSDNRDPSLYIVCDRFALDTTINFILSRIVTSINVEVIYIHDSYDGLPEDLYNMWRRSHEEVNYTPAIVADKKNYLYNGYITAEIGWGQSGSGLRITNTKNVLIWEEDSRVLKELVAYLKQNGFPETNNKMGVDDVYSFYLYRPRETFAKKHLEEDLYSQGFYKQA